MSSAPDIAKALPLSGLVAALSGDSANAEGYQVVGAKNLYRTQDRPWAQIPTGAKLLVRTPAGVTLADVHRLAAGGAANERSPLAVPGVKVEVVRSGDLYELRLTHEQRSQAIEVQRRAKAL
ncbi:MAG TPA: hypothetical protein VFX59_00835 [Polyangiales bacterium]|nr:hypothetical protein [Polyangiales bacterium]